MARRTAWNEFALPAGSTGLARAASNSVELGGAVIDREAGYSLERVVAGLTGMSGRLPEVGSTMRKPSGA